MKKILGLVICSLMFIFVGCSSLFNNEIFNTSYDVTININDFNDLLAACVQKVEKSVVGIINRGSVSLFGSNVSTGSGVVFQGRARMKNGTWINDITLTKDSIDVDYYEYMVVTNKHVVEGNNRTYKVYIDDEELSANLVRRDDIYDLAVLKFNDGRYIPLIEFGDSDDMKSGNFVLAIGSPGGLELYNSVSFGVVSYPKRYLHDEDSRTTVEWIQHSAPINPGNSGGALINIKGELIGINTMKYAIEYAKDEMIVYEGLGFAIPSNVVKREVSYLANGLLPPRIVLGLTAMRLSVAKEEENINIDTLLKSGIYISEVSLSSLAHSKIFVGDIIISANGVEINQVYILQCMLRDYKPGDNIIFKLERNKIIVEVTITL